MPGLQRGETVSRLACGRAGGGTKEYVLEFYEEGRLTGLRIDPNGQPQQRPLVPRRRRAVLEREVTILRP